MSSVLYGSTCPKTQHPWLHRPLAQPALEGTSRKANESLAQAYVWHPVVRHKRIERAEFDVQKFRGLRVRKKGIAVIHCLPPSALWPRANSFHLTGGKYPAASLRNAAGRRFRSGFLAEHRDALVGGSQPS